MPLVSCRQPPPLPSSRLLIVARAISLTTALQTTADTSPPTGPTIHHYSLTRLSRSWQSRRVAHSVHNARTSSILYVLFLLLTMESS